MVFQKPQCAVGVWSSSSQVLGALTPKRAYSLMVEKQAKSLVLPKEESIGDCVKDSS